MIGRVLYAVTFCILIPGLLAWWAWRLDAVVALPLVKFPGVGLALALAGVGLMVWSMWSLWRIGGGLPMNAYPPCRRVACGLFAIFQDPIYTGFVVACAGVSLVAGSAAGWWIVTPAAALACAALVLGYERDATIRRFGPPVTRPLLSLPPCDDAPVRWRDIAGVWALVLLPWLVIYEAVGHLPVPAARDMMTACERGWPVIPWTELVYASAYPAVVLAPVLAGRRDRLRRFAEAGLVATVLATLAYLTVPAIAPPRPVTGTGWLADLLRWERADGLNGRAAYPAFHVTWALMAAGVYSARAGTRTWATVPWLWAVAVATSCLTTGMHAAADIVAGVLLWVVAWWWRDFAAVLARWAENLANSWREWRIGPIRIISHAAFAGLAATLGVLFVTGLAGPRHIGAIAITSGAALIGAAVWGQIFVQRPTTARPFGYFGCLLGGAAGVLIARAMGLGGWSVVSAFTVAAPWVQAVGRLRCLVQGCCHGRPTSSFLAISYHHPRTRVCRVAGLAGTPLHPTPLYSILGNIAIGMLLARLWEVRASAAFIAGSYLILAGLLRFVEEHYRGEPHTPVRAGLRVYQWFATLSVITGIVITTLPCSPVPGGWSWSGVSLLVSGLIGLVYAAAMGVDVPGSERRFARLA